MASFHGIKVTGVNRSGFDVVKAFAELDSARKLALFDQMNGATKTFYNTVTLLWPQAKASDCKQLERFMVQRMAANDS
tara:strand:- start:97 stop:330 length:234 start_codon:yes stop_codon:yes gene_type:complete